MMKVGKDFYIKCDRCGCIALVEADSLDYETYSCERSMGDEIEYVFDDYFENYAYEQFIRAEDVIEHNRERVKHMSSREFEEFVGALFEKMGYRVKITQRTRDGGLANLSGVPLRTIQQYEQRQKNINHARAEYVINLSRVLGCEPGELMER